MLPMIDTHQHLWDLEQFFLPWLQWEGMDPCGRVISSATIWKPRPHAMSVPDPKGESNG